ncbi:MAG: elongation factor 4 [Candidatus Moraniibacteriota bacterium]|nr:MAG: elongation factor 4 [Candidatus Moranbacteria bacterium]
MDQRFIRNFCIIAHIDHGKSTLADRLLEETATVEKRKMKAQLLDQMDLERERGITIKLQPVRMEYEYQAKVGGKNLGGENDKSEAGNQESRSRKKDVSTIPFGKYVLNLIDTPGHVDFHYEVSRSLAAVEGAILLVDATKGVQAQTLANLYLAIEEGLEIIPVINKVDLPAANVEKTKKEILHVLGCLETDILLASGKTGLGVSDILRAVVERVPAPRGNRDEPLRALIFDSAYNTYKGVVASVRIVDGMVRRDDVLRMMATSTESLAIEAGIMKPELVPVGELSAGDIGYLATGQKDVASCRVGDTITIAIRGDRQSGVGTVEALPGYQDVKPMVYASLYPVDGDDYAEMRDALDKLKLNDAAFAFEPESNVALGRGFRCGFLGLLHLEIVQARLEREFEITPTITTPSVIYELELRGKEGRVPLYSPMDMPDPASIEAIYEPYVDLKVVAPTSFLGALMDLSASIRAEYRNTEYLDEERVLLTFDAPLMDVIVSFHDRLKSVSSGFASMNYEPIGYRKSDVVRLDIIVANEPVEAFSRMVPKSRAFSEGKETVEKLKTVIPRHNFAVAIQAAVGGKVIARETISAFRKDVIAKLYGGDVTRKRKLLEKQKKGKKKMRAIGGVTIPPQAFLDVLRKNDG